mmetsp:Transcript_4654/g.11243  ORF Transcript_4654/g.11243 Transcript_4654/m.11243 type:complete len:992 (-) Transcript_4654:73-3048(-)
MARRDLSEAVDVRAIRRELGETYGLRGADEQLVHLATRCVEQERRIGALGARVRELAAAYADEAARRARAERRAAVALSHASAGEELKLEAATLEVELEGTRADLQGRLRAHALALGRATAAAAAERRGAASELASQKLLLEAAHARLADETRHRKSLAQTAEVLRERLREADVREGAATTNTMEAGKAAALGRQVHSLTRQLRELHAQHALALEAARRELGEKLDAAEGRTIHHLERARRNARGALTEGLARKEIAIEVANAESLCAHADAHKLRAELARSRAHSLLKADGLAALVNSSNGLTIDLAQSERERERLLEREATLEARVAELDGAGLETFSQLQQGRSALLKSEQLNGMLTSQLEHAQLLAVKEVERAQEIAFKEISLKEIALKEVFSLKEVAEAADAKEREREALAAAALAPDLAAVAAAAAADLEAEAEKEAEHRTAHTAAEDVGLGGRHLRTGKQLQSQLTHALAIDKDTYSPVIAAERAALQSLGGRARAAEEQARFIALRLGGDPALSSSFPPSPSAAAAAVAAAPAEVVEERLEREREGALQAQLHSTETALRLLQREREKGREKEREREEAVWSERRSRAQLQQQWQAEKGQLQGQWQAEKWQLQQQRELDRGQLQKEWEVEKGHLQGQWEAEKGQLQLQWQLQLQGQWKAEKRQMQEEWTGQWDAEKERLQRQWRAEQAQREFSWRASSQVAERAFAEAQQGAAAEAAALTDGHAAVAEGLFALASLLAAARAHASKRTENALSGSLPDFFRTLPDSPFPATQPHSLDAALRLLTSEAKTSSHAVQSLAEHAVQLERRVLELGVLATVQTAAAEAEAARTALLATELGRADMELAKTRAEQRAQAGAAAGVLQRVHALQHEWEQAASVLRSGESGAGRQQVAKGARAREVFDSRQPTPVRALPPRPRLLGGADRALWDEARGDDATLDAAAGTGRGEQDARAAGLLFPHHASSVRAGTPQGTPVRRGTPVRSEI